VISAADAQELLGEDEALVVINLAETSEGDYDYVWALGRNSAAWKTLGTKKGEIADEITTLRSQLDPNADKPFDA
jgi:hypothetical protein